MVYILSSNLSYVSKYTKTILKFCGIILSTKRNGMFLFAFLGFKKY